MIEGEPDQNDAEEASQRLPFDRGRWTERNWLHWSSVFTLFLLLLLQVAWQFAWRAMINQ